MDKINIIGSGGSRVPIFKGKSSEFQTWVEAIKKKSKIYKLSQADIVNLAYDYSDGVVSEYIGLYLEDHPECSWEELLQQLNNQYGNCTSAANAARALIKVRQKEGETLPELTSRILGLAKIAYKDAVQREGEVIQMQLAEFFTDAIENPFVREDTARACPTTLSEAFNAAQQSLRLHERLVRLREQMSGVRWQDEGRFVRPPQNNGSRWRYGQTDRHWENYTPSKSWTESPLRPGRRRCWGCGQLGHLMRECSSQKELSHVRKGTERHQGNTWGATHTDVRVGRSYGQSTEAACNVLVGGKYMQALLDMGACISIIRLRDFWKFSHKSRKLESSDVRIIQADGRGIRIIGMIWLPIIVGGISTLQKLYVTPNTCRAMILGRDWLEKNKAQISFNPTILKLGGKEIPLGVQMNEKATALTTKDIVLPPHTAIACKGCLSPAGNRRQGIYRVTPTENDFFEEGEITVHESVIEGGGTGDIPIMIGNTSNTTIKIPKGEEVGRAALTSIMKQMEGQRNLAHVQINSIVNEKEILAPFEHMESIRQLVNKNRDLVANSDKDLGRTQTVQMKIDTGDHPPIKFKTYRTPIHKRKKEEEAVRDMLESRVIEHSRSPWSFPIVVGSKKDGGHRFCVDFRALNKITRPLAYPLPLIDDILPLLGKFTYFSTLDLRSGYWQVALDRNDREKTALACHAGLYQFRVMPFRLANAPGNFQQFMSVVLGRLEQFTMVYLDDIQVFSTNASEYLQHLQIVFSQ